MLLLLQRLLRCQSQLWRAVLPPPSQFAEIGREFARDQLGFHHRPCPQSKVQLFILARIVTIDPAKHLVAPGVASKLRG